MILKMKLIIYATSISNDDLNVNIIQDLHYSFKEFLNKNLINIVFVNEFEEQIINLVSVEKSFLFSFWKYEYNRNSPKDYYPIKRTLFKRYNENEDILTLEKNSIYIIIAEKYKFGSDNLNTIEIFVSQAQIYKNVFLYPNDDYLYLKASEESYVINFSYFSYYNRVLKLSKKSYKSIVTLNGDIILDSKNHYYELNEEQMNGGIEIEVSNNDCLIELLFSSKNNFDFDVLDFYSIERYKLNKKYTIIKIPKNKCTYEFKFTNENKYNLPSFDFSYTTKISKSSFFSNCLGLRIPSYKNEITLNISTPYLYNTKVDDDEFQILEIVLEQKQLDNNIYLTYSPTSFFKYLQKEIDETKAQHIIDNITRILQKFYIYKDIAKIPPEIENIKNYHHKPIDLIESLNKISAKNKTYLSLYQNINQILSSVRDKHLDIQLNIIDNKINISSCLFYLPFDLYIDIQEGMEVVKIKANKLTSNDLKEFLEKNIDIPLKFINRTEPFEYIQNFGKYQRFKNKHAQFTFNLKAIKFSYIMVIPYDLSDLTNIEFEFKNGDILNIDYKLYYNNSIDLIQKESVDSSNSINLQSRKLLNEENPKKIYWDYQTEDGLLKCKVDNIHKYNIFLQTRFSYSNFWNAINTMINCSKLFHENDYKIIGIENENNGGNPLLYEIWHQLIQIKTLDKSFSALIKNNDAFNYFKNISLFSSFSNIETCKYFGSQEDMGEIIDDYGTSEVFNEEIKHHRTNLYDFLDKYGRKELEKIRKEYYNKKKGF